LGGLAVALLAHELLPRLLAGHTAAAQWLSPGAHSPWVALVACGALVLLRLFVVVVLPAIVAAWLTLVLSRRLLRSRQS
jgi:hypothetical protein